MGLYWAKIWPSDNDKEIMRTNKSFITSIKRKQDMHIWYESGEQEVIRDIVHDTYDDAKIFWMLTDENLATYCRRLSTIVKIDKGISSESKLKDLKF